MMKPDEQINRGTFGTDAHIHYMASPDDKTIGTKFIFKANHFYELLEKTQYKCPYSGRELTPANCVAEHITPLRLQGRHEASNIVLVDHEVAYLKRYLSDDAVLKLAVEIVNTLGKNRGYKISKHKI